MATRADSFRCEWHGGLCAVHVLAHVDVDVGEGVVKDEPVLLGDGHGRRDITTNHDEIKRAKSVSETNSIIHFCTANA